ncbi:MAG TPA: hypothetical protein VFJ94_05095 [Intrasporangium sp.]|uniref:hypothetical protein n=1 Tax=Intrasporangium sp. TaxID=1925024 RepID=UPI002D789DFE|nr:hypothetical protein [Intrasporangium sp.]HET7397879.1 hypothetical protein [Intrasporangium sp.]
MQIDKQQILEFLKQRGEHDKAEQAASQLPDQVDTDQHEGLLGSLGINPAELLGNLANQAGLGGLGDLGGKLGL